MNLPTEFHDGVQTNADDLRLEYDFMLLRNGVRAKHLGRYRGGTNLALLRPEIHTAFPTDEAATEPCSR